ncbi:CTD kinase subunit alpha [Schizosaccharomyces pombe]|uniref:CTD kinase subunit alpha n=1 Tax=Schizosaccharomyces pombe (strain 972 / ATCC 24843) TaxID=284812 RepID=CTK1_SCHPO|nr:P-TEFb-associated cyclin-dependent protein kinase Lsk1 [Schizosaccharomyces pombe]O14098.1 RecName: Full=CTD kinase subunit alpha; Short=CTDK-I subunit alpha; AltName: Full=CTD kinase subunit 1; AltName: Full=Latrunculin sensitive kinase 1 [Schizosaccharomyces pombe 972h-]CAB16269.1 P-TEFb-associated cyclin-dependent protein kinase Lsk1 [Schizosaccharomyces pombe]|eukprot:NP_594393.1 P-TEFb-associated cyclin-dependent protein kinase Lsk1 [Schizosaccharomyces pombe]
MSYSKSTIYRRQGTEPNSHFRRTVEEKSQLSGTNEESLGGHTLSSNAFKNNSSSISPSSSAKDPREQRKRTFPLNDTHSSRARQHERPFRSRKSRRRKGKKAFSPRPGSPPSPSFYRSGSQKRARNLTTKDYFAKRSESSSSASVSPISPSANRNDSKRQASSFRRSPPSSVHMKPSAFNGRKVSRRPSSSPPPIPSIPHETTSSDTQKKSSVSSGFPENKHGKFHFHIPNERRSRFDQPPSKRMALTSTARESVPAPLPSPPSGPIYTYTYPKPAYEKIDQIGEGTYGKVYKAINTVTGDLVALKRIRLEQEKDGFPITTVREVKILQRLRHKNIVRLLEIMVEKSSVYMVFEYMDHDLTGVLLNSQLHFTPGNIKHLSKQIFEALAYLHHRGVLHRDIKGSNILLNNNGDLKFADFGLARFNTSSKSANYTNRVITLWFRPPELLLGETAYDTAVDIWSAGCIVMELFTGKPFFQGRDEISQLEVIYDMMGTPDVHSWPEVKNLPWYELLKPVEEKKSRFVETFKEILSPAAIDLCQKLLALNPFCRPSAHETLMHEYFTSESPPPEPAVILKNMQGSWHEWESKKRKSKR